MSPEKMLYKIAVQFDTADYKQLSIPEQNICDLLAENGWILYAKEESCITIGLSGYAEKWKD